MNRVLIAILLMGFTTIVQASNVLQIWSCTTNEGKTRADLEAVSSAWLKAAPCSSSSISSSTKVEVE